MAESSSDESTDLRDHPWIKSLLDADIAPRTKSQYVRSLTTLTTLAGGRSLETIIAHPKAMLKRINAKSEKLQTRKALVSAIKALAKYNPSLKEEYATELDKWSERFRELDRGIAERVGSAEPTEKELVNWVDWPEVMRKQHELGTLCYGSTPHLLLSMYSLIEPIRADLGLVRIMYEGSGEEPGPDANFIVISRRSNQSTLVLQTYKTSKRYGRFERDIPDQLVSIIRSSLERRPRRWLFVDDYGEPYKNRNSYTRFANRVFERIFNKRFTISLLRHSFVSNLNFNEATPTELFKHSKNMMHSIGMQQMYRRRIVPKVSVQRIPRDGGPVRPQTPHAGRTMLI